MWYRISSSFLFLVKQLKNVLGFGGSPSTLGGGSRRISSRSPSATKQVPGWLKKKGACKRQLFPGPLFLKTNLTFEFLYLEGDFG